MDGKKICIIFAVVAAIAPLVVNAVIFYFLKIRKDEEPKMAKNPKNKGTIALTQSTETIR